MQFKAERKIIKGKLSFETGLHIGSGEERDWIDSTIIKTKDDKPFVPGTTLAGIFRQLAEENFPSNQVEGLFGYVKQKSDGTTESSAARLIFCDAFISSASIIGHRDGVGIRRDTLTSREGAPFSLETVEKPRFDFKLIIDNPQSSDMQILEPILAEFQSGRVALGGDKSRGLGWAKLSDLQFADISPENFDDFINYLIDDEIKFQELKITHTKTDGACNHIVIEYRLTLEDIDASLIVSSGILGFTEDADQTLIRDETGKFFVPGSSIKGPLRAQAERVIRFLKGDACDPTDMDDNCSKKIKDRIKSSEESQDNLYQIVEELSCPICKIFGNGYLASKIFFTDVYDETEQTTQIIENVAIDRFTGGTLEGAKFNTEVATRVNLKGRIILKNIDEWQAGLIAFVLRDWMMGDIRIGFGKMNGYGRCKINLEKITLCWQDENWLKDKIYGTKKKSGFYNSAVLEGDQLRLDKYKNVLEVLIKELKNKLKK
jgi:CRISPR-associated RAMP protein (TIGR02581 family)